MKEDLSDISSVPASQIEKEINPDSYPNLNTRVELLPPAAWPAREVLANSFNEGLTLAEICGKIRRRSGLVGWNERQTIINT